MNEYHLDWRKALMAGLVVSLATWASGRLFPGRRAAPFIGAAIGIAILILASYASWTLSHR
jgi:sugar phosphate permease